MSFEWTSDRVETLKNLWATGQTAREIAVTLGNGISRNAVIGKANRLGLSSTTTMRVKPITTFAVTPSERSCQWPIGHPTDVGFRFCGKPALRERPYCDAHCNIAYRRKFVTENSN